MSAQGDEHEWSAGAVGSGTGGRSTRLIEGHRPERLGGQAAARSGLQYEARIHARVEVDACSAAGRGRRATARERPATSHVTYYRKQRQRRGVKELQEDGDCSSSSSPTARPPAQVDAQQASWRSVGRDCLKGVHPNQWAKRLRRVAHGFAGYLQTIDPATEIPAAGRVPDSSPARHPITVLRAGHLQPVREARRLSRPLRAVSYEALFGLLAVSWHAGRGGARSPASTRPCERAGRLALRRDTTHANAVQPPRRAGAEPQ